MEWVLLFSMWASGHSPGGGTVILQRYPDREQCMAAQTALQEEYQRRVGGSELANTTCLPVQKPR